MALESRLIINASYGYRVSAILVIWLLLSGSVFQKKPDRVEFGASVVVKGYLKGFEIGMNVRL